MARRVRLGLWLCLIPVAAYATADLLWYVESAHLLLPIKLAVTGAVLGCMALLSSALGRRHPDRVGLLGFAPLCVGSALSGAITGEVLPSAVLICSLCLGSGVLLPWGPVHQLTLALFGAICLGWLSLVVAGELLPLGAASIAISFGLFVSVLTSRETARSRRERLRAEGALLAKSSELAAINHAMTRYLERADVRDASEILLRAALEQTGSGCGMAALVEGSRLRVMALAGIDLGDAESRRLLARAPRSDKALLEIADLENPVGTAVREGREVVTNSPPAELRAAGLPGLRPALANLLAVPVRRGRDVVGVLALGNRSGGYSGAHTVRLQGLCRTASVIYDSFRNQEARRADREVSGALARVGRELLSSVDAPELLERLCQTTTEALGCQSSHTLLYRADEGIFTPVAGHGDSPESWESIRQLRLPAELFASLVARFDHVEVQELEPRRDAPNELSGGPLARILAGEGGEGSVTRTLWVALRRGGEIIGLHTAAFRRDGTEVGQREQRIVEGIGRLASLALRNALLVEELARANLVRSKLVDTMSHELRTPLNIALGYCDMLRDGAAGELSEKQRDLLRRIRQSMRELGDLVESTLELSRLDTGRVEIDAADVVLFDLFEELRSDVEGLARPGVDVTWNTAPSLHVATDRLKVKILIKNLVRNALKFTHQGRIEVSAGEDAAGGIELRVHDTGIGIEPGAKDAIFEPFRRAVDEDLYGGVGLGLHVVRRLVETLGGAIEVESEPGRGSTFTVRLPFAR